MIFLTSGCGWLPWASGGGELKGEVIDANQSYRLGPNDVLRIQVFGEPTLTTETEVSGQGKVKFPLLGELDIGGKTVNEVEAYVVSRLKDGYLKDPKVTVFITKYRNIYISGQVIRPGAYPYQAGMTVLRAITLAGGVNEKAAKSWIKVLRTVNGKEQMIDVEMNDSIYPDDIITVPESYF